MYCVIYYDTNMRSWLQTRNQMLWFINDVFMCQVGMAGSVLDSFYCLVKCRVITEESNSPKDLFQSYWPFVI